MGFLKRKSNKLIFLAMTTLINLNFVLSQMKFLDREKGGFLSRDHGKGFRLKPVPVTTPVPHQKDDVEPDLCRDKHLNIDAITTLPNGHIYVFKGNYVFQIDSTGKGVLKGWPKKIDNVFKGIEGPLDAVLTWKNGKTYFFKGKQYWRSHGTKMDSGYPKKISKHMKGIPDKIDSAFQLRGAIYFTKGDQFWKFDPTKWPHVSEKNPVPLYVWDMGRDVNMIDAGFKAPNGNTYLFSGDLFWQFDEDRFKAVRDWRPTYLRTSQVIWFGCTGGRPAAEEIKEDDGQENSIVRFPDY